MKCGRSVPLKEETEVNLRITIREGLRVDARQIEGRGPLGGEDRKQEADKRHANGAYPAAHGCEHKMRRIALPLVKIRTELQNENRILLFGFAPH